MIMSKKPKMKRVVTLRQARKVVSGGVSVSALPCREEDEVCVPLTSCAGVVDDQSLGEGCSNSG
jgi:hypothetical protein